MWMHVWDFLNAHWGTITAITSAASIVLTVVTVPWILMIKKEPLSAWAWCLTVVLLPFVGSFLFLVFGYQHVHRPLTRKREHKFYFRQQRLHHNDPANVFDLSGHDPRWAGMSRLAERLDAFPPTGGNRVTFFHEGQPAYDAKLEAIRNAKHHVHLEYFIFQPDGSGCAFIDALAERARSGVEVRLLYDAMGSYRLSNRLVRTLRRSGGKCEPFLPLFNPLRKRTQVNLRNHRKILVVDGKIAFTGGLNIGDEYLGKNKYFGFWRDTHMRIEGPAAKDLQRIFVEDWDFASGELVHGSRYFPKLEGRDGWPVQVVQSGPDQELKSIREIYFAGILRAQKRLWIASPYFVPDSGLRDALILAGHSGIDVRLLGLSHPDKWLPYLAGRYYWTDMLAAGVKVYQYTKGMMHSKLMLIDGEWASVGTANLDTRSLYLNFEENCLLYDARAVAELEAAFLRDLETAVPLELESYLRRPLPTRLAENVCRLFSPIL
jgi:cardiolipin synthase